MNLFSQSVENKCLQEWGSVFYVKHVKSNGSFPYNGIIAVPMLIPAKALTASTVIPITYQQQASRLSTPPFRHLLATHILICVCQWHHRSLARSFISDLSRKRMLCLSIRNVLVKSSFLGCYCATWSIKSLAAT